MKIINKERRRLLLTKKLQLMKMEDHQNPYHHSLRHKTTITKNKMNTTTICKYCRCYPCRCCMDLKEIENMLNLKFNMKL